MRSKFLIILIAPSGGGKTTILKEVLAKCPDIDYSISFTTRPPRGDEKDGQAYFFISEDEFKNRIEQGEFLEYAYVHGHWYGTSRVFIQQRLAAGRHVILDIDVQGAESLMGQGLDAVTVFLLPPTSDVWQHRLTQRGTDTDEQIKLRVKNASTELSRLERFRYLVINDNLETAVQQVIGIIRAEENRLVRYKNVLNTFNEV